MDTHLQQSPPSRETMLWAYLSHSKGHNVLVLFDGVLVHHEEVSFALLLG